MAMASEMSAAPSELGSPRWKSGRGLHLSGMAFASASSDRPLQRLERTGEGIVSKRLHFDPPPEIGPDPAPDERLQPLSRVEDQFLKRAPVPMLRSFNEIWNLQSFGHDTLHCNPLFRRERER